MIRLDETTSRARVCVAYGRRLRESDALCDLAQLHGDKTGRWALAWRVWLLHRARYAELLDPAVPQ